MPEKSTHSTSTSTSTSTGTGTGSGSGSSNSSVFGKCRPVSSFQKIGRIGEGTYGTVYKALDKDTKKIVALKRIIMHNEKHDGFPLTSIREIDTLRRTDHPNCVKMLDVVVGHKRDGVFLVFEYCEHDISALLDKVRTPFSESEIKSLVFQLLSAVAYLHEHWIIHRDIKLSNLLYNNKGEVKLADFGLARTFPSHCPAKAQGDLKSNMGGGGQGFVRPKYTTDVRMTLKVVTLWYRAPELLLGSDSYTTAIDVWAVGCVLGELLLGRPLLPGDTELDQIHRIFELLGCPSSRIWTDLPALKAFSSNSNCRKSNSLPYSLNLYEEQKKYPFSNLQAMFPSPSRIGDNGLECLNSMLTFDPKRRITARESLRHIYFSSSPYPKESDMMPTFPSQHDDYEEGLSDNIQLQSGAHSGREGEEGDFSNSSHKVVDRRGNESRGSSSLGSFASALATSYSSTTKSRISGSNSNNKYRYSDSDHRHRVSSGHHKRSDRGSSVSVESNNRKRYRDAT